MNRACCAVIGLVVCLSIAGLAAAESIRHSNAWSEEEGVRAAWFGYKVCTDDMANALVKADVNTVFLAYGFHDLLDLDSLRWEGESLKGQVRETTLERLLGVTYNAANQGIHVFWMANYELEIMLPHLKRLGYHPAYAEGPGRYLRPGPHDDASALDPVFWRGITGLHGEIVAHLSLEHPIEGSLYDSEHYAKGMMYLQNSGFADIAFAPFAESHGVTEPVPLGKRYDYLTTHGLLTQYYHYLEEQAFAQGRYLADRCHAINPHLTLGVWPLLDNWFAQGYLRGLGGTIRSLGFSGVEYYHGADQTKSLSQLFEARVPNMRYMAGFYPPYAYTTSQLGFHVTQAIRDTNAYWMLSPHEQLLQPEYQKALHTAHTKIAPPLHPEMSVSLEYRVHTNGNEPELVVATQTGIADTTESPRLTLRATLGGAALCERLVMQPTDDGRYEARVPLLRRLTNNRNLSRGFRAGINYTLMPLPLARGYEDPHHTKLFDGMAYGYFSTTVAWPSSIQSAEVVFDLGRSFSVERVILSQPYKLEDRVGGPSTRFVSLSNKPGVWTDDFAFQADMSMSGDDASHSKGKVEVDPVYHRAWLAWKTDSIRQNARWLRLLLDRTKPNSSISLGEVVIWGQFEGAIEAYIYDDSRRIAIDSGHQYVIK
jgi:hypothetical protein